jgi:hypothetical protein
VSRGAGWEMKSAYRPRKKKFMHVIIVRLSASGFTTIAIVWTAGTHPRGQIDRCNEKGSSTDRMTRAKILEQSPSC